MYSRKSTSCLPFPKVFIVLLCTQKVHQILRSRDHLRVGKVLILSPLDAWSDGLNVKMKLGLFFLVFLNERIRRRCTLKAHGYLGEKSSSVKVKVERLKYVRKKRNKRRHAGGE